MVLGARRLLLCVSPTLAPGTGCGEKSGITHRDAQNGARSTTPLRRQRIRGCASPLANPCGSEGKIDTAFSLREGGGPTAVSEGRDSDLHDFDQLLAHLSLMIVAQVAQAPAD